MRRSTVRILEPRRGSRTAALSFAAAGITAVFLFIIWRFWQSEEVAAPRQRTIVEWEVVWKCDVGHAFEASGKMGVRDCWTCGRPAYRITRYVCPTDGDFEVSARFAPGDDGVLRPSYLRLPGKEWVPAKGGLRCPRCQRAILNKPLDPFEILARRKNAEG